MTAPRLQVVELQVRGVRNLEPSSVAFHPQLNVVTGDNGHGKTSLLEAVYLACTTKSFRTPRLREVVAHGATQLLVTARISERRGSLEPLLREQRLGSERGRVSVRIDGNKPETLASYAVRSPVVVFHPDELALSSGPAGLRRRLLDRVALYTAPASARAASAFTAALRSRQELLRRGGSPAELDAFEHVLAASGAELTRARRRAVEELEPAYLEAFRRIGAPELRVSMSYQPAGSPDVEVLARELYERRARDTRAPTATFGPHRDDLALALDGHPVRLVASQGQHRAITLALKAAESASIARVTGLEPLQLLDDVSSELDRDRTEALFSFLREARGQVFLTTPRSDLVAHAFAGQDRKVFHVVGGLVTTL